jgi:hypothetical protein
MLAAAAEPRPNPLSIAAERPGSRKKTRAAMK